MLMWLMGGGRKLRHAKAETPSSAAYSGPLVLPTNPSPEQAMRLGLFALQFLH